MLRDTLVMQRRVLGDGRTNTLETATNLALLPSRHRRQSVKLQMNADAHAGHYCRRLHDYTHAQISYVPHPF